MFKFFKNLNEKELECTLDEFEKTHTITNQQYSTCYYHSNYTSKVWHCVMITYK